MEYTPWDQLDEEMRDAYLSAIEALKGAGADDSSLFAVLENKLDDLEPEA